MYFSARRRLERVVLTAIPLTTTDTNMAIEGGAHTEHHHVLLGLKPDTEHQFIFSAIGPRGEGYRSKDYTFRTPPG